MTHAELEFKVLEEFVEEPIALPFKDEILSLVEKVMKSGQSGGSIPYTASVVAHTVEILCNQKNIYKITGEDFEWIDVSEYNEGEPLWQNLRNSSIFKDASGKAYYLDAIVFNGNLGGSFTSNGSIEINGEKVTSKQYIKAFPFEPKTFYVDVIDYRWKDEEESEQDPEGNWWTHEITKKGRIELFKAFNYYDKFKIE